ncbi:hypothetical protein SAMN05444422_10891 [Halobiforma haloterrestris]|uniref:Uncharacterized protein n=1 Tax=Natronobacterium haloterrestre TaxID=148448 RepID=A0A1I1J389_NATHA|nr:winged-helix domain-containing protein [Halobiforma haloterrestris]SFC42482.1 hypothetical protein SAMN05444422_10891 [Halobiforma haloterrestris]
MPPDLDRRMYDILRLVDHHGPIGSIQLVELMQLHGYDIKDRTIRLALSELDELGLTEKVPGQGRRLTERGRRELEQGDVNARLERIRARIATLSSRVTYDPGEDGGDVIASCVFLEEDIVDDALDLVARLDALPLGPVPIRLEESNAEEPGDRRLLAPSSITLDGVLLTRGIDARLTNAAVLEYEPVESRSDPSGPADALDPDANPPSSAGGRILRHVDVIDGEGSSIDVVTLLIEAGRNDVAGILEADGADGEADSESDRPRGTGLLVGDDREFPINRLEEARDLTVATRDALGGVVDFQRPRERDRLPGGDPTWAFGSVTHVGSGELLLAALDEYGLATSWETLYGTMPRREFESVTRVTTETADD